MTRPFAMISPKAMKNGTPGWVEAYIGTGPYVLDEFVTDEYAVFKANPNYWGEQPAIKTITVKVIPDNQTRILALEKGEIDIEGRTDSLVYSAGGGAKERGIIFCKNLFK